jgi:hypothetical protein
MRNLHHCLTMVQYTNKNQKAVIFLMLACNEPPKTIANHVGVSLRQAQRYRQRYLLTGSPFLPSRASQNATILAPWAMDVSL